MKQILTYLLGLIISLSAWSHTPAEIKTAAYLDSIKTYPAQLTTFLWAMPKGGDLHLHMSGSSYAENMLQYSHNDNLCINPQTYTVSSDPNCDANNYLSLAIENIDFYNKVIDAWSMRHFDTTYESGHDHFFATFAKFSLIGKKHRGEILAELSLRAALQNESYLEIMTRPDGSDASRLGEEVGWYSDFKILHQKILAHPNFNTVINKITQVLNQDEATKQTLLACTTNDSKPGCQIKLRYLYEALREQAPEKVFAQLLVGFETAQRENRIVGLNLVQPEDGPISMRDYQLHMQMIAYLHKQYPKTPISLHAGELTGALVPKEGLKFHIHEAVNVAKAMRIGHGVDILEEDSHEELLKKMAKKNILVEINLTSNALILNVNGKNHPLPVYLKYGIPVAFSTDDEGISRSNLTQEFKRAVDNFQLDYFTLKTAIRNSLNYSFLPGNSLWTDKTYQQLATPCAKDVAGSKAPTPHCKAFLNQHEKAAQLWDLEKRFRRFEKQYGNQYGVSK